MFQSGLTNISNRIFRHAGDIYIWLDEFLAQALLINMHDFFAGQVNCILHPACDAMHHIKFSTSNSPFQMKSVDDNIAFLDCSSPTSIGEPSCLPYFSDVKTNVFVTKKQLEVVAFINKYVRQSNMLCLYWRIHLIFV